MLVMMVVLMVGWFWYGGPGRHGGDHMGGQQQAIPAEKTPLELLDAAYARGEITREEYLQRRADLLKR